MRGGMTVGAGPSAEQPWRRSRSYDSLTGCGGGLYWVESRPDEGRSVVGSWPCPPGANVAGFAVGNAVHAYGGGPYVVADSGVWLVSAADGQVWRADTGERCTDSPFPHADLAWHDGVVTCVREGLDGDELIVVHLATGQDLVVHRADFLAAPQMCDGRLVWVQWSAEVVPWDSSEVWVGNYQPGGRLCGVVRVAGGLQESATQPRWGPDGALYFLSDRTGWWNLYRWHGGEVETVAPMRADCAPAPWELGYSSYAFLSSGRIAMITQRGPEHRLVVVELGGHVRELDTPFTFVKPYLAGVDDRVALIGATPTLRQQVAVVSTDSSNTVDVICGGEDQPPGPVSTPELLTVASGGVDVTVVFYPPLGSRAEGPAPLIVRAHPGPTHNCELRWDSEVQFFASRGYAVADVDYRGSTGYGRTFRKALDGCWGVLDVADCCAAASHLIESGRAIRDAVFISGASAGGYTALRAACVADAPFALAVARSAVVNPRRWTETAPRFQRPHAAILSHERTDVGAQEVQRPVLLIHGDEDNVAPLADVVELASHLDKRHLLLGCVILPGVGHYLSAPDAQAAALHAELDAYEAVLTARGLRG